MKRITVSVLIILAFMAVLTARQKSDSHIDGNKEAYVRALRYYNLAVAADAAGKTDSTGFYIRESLSLSLSYSFSELTADNYRLLGLAYGKTSDWENTLKNLLRAGTRYGLAGLRAKEAGVWDLVAGRYLSFGVFRKAKSYSDHSFRLYTSSLPVDKALSAETAGKASFMVNDYSSSVKWFDTAYVWFARQADTSGMVRTLQGSASSYIKILDTSIPLSALISGRFDITSVTSRVVGSISAVQALKRYEVLLAVSERQGDYAALAEACYSTGYIYFRLEDYRKAGERFERAIEYMEAEKTISEDRVSAVTNLAICYQNTGNEDKALRTFSRALDYADRAGLLSEVARIDHIMAVIYLKDYDFYHAELYCNECIKNSKASGSYDILQQCYQTYSGVKEQGNDFIRALEYFQRHLALRDSLTVVREMADREREQQIAYYEALEQKVLLDISEEDLRYLTIRKLRADSLSMRSELRALRSDSISKQSEIMALRATADLKASEQQRLRQALDLEVERNRTQQQQRDIVALEQEKKISDLTLRTQADEQERLLQQLELEKARRTTAVVLVILAVIVALTILGSLISARARNRKLAESKKHIEEINLDLEKKNAEISDQKEVIEQKNKSITDSILYASRIQSAVLLPASLMNDWGIENFILFMPKDIVSGDFYWGSRRKGKLVIAAADCTGHGVPGAFMSMLGNAFLNEIVNTTAEPDAAVILNALRDEVIRALKQKGVTGEARDGMDIALCVIDPETLTGTFAGANNPMYLVRDRELIKIPADRMPIGIHVVAEKPFTSQSFALKKGDNVYLFTDGYADQFGGPAGKKFMYKPFQELLVSVSDKSPAEQQEILTKTFTEWQGENEQVDDVLVMGFRIS